MGEWGWISVKGTDSLRIGEIWLCDWCVHTGLSCVCSGWRSDGSNILEDAVGWRKGGASIGPCRLIEGAAAHGTRRTLCVAEISYAVSRHPLRTCPRHLDCKVTGHCKVESVFS